MSFWIRFWFKIKLNFLQCVLICFTATPLLWWIERIHRPVGEMRQAKWRGHQTTSPLLEDAFLKKRKKKWKKINRKRRWKLDFEESQLIWHSALVVLFIPKKATTTKETKKKKRRTRWNRKKKKNNHSNWRVQSTTATLQHLLQQVANKLPWQWPF